MTGFCDSIHVYCIAEITGPYVCIDKCFKHWQWVYLFACLLAIKYAKQQTHCNVWNTYLYIVLNIHVILLMSKSHSSFLFFFFCKKMYRSSPIMMLKQYFCVQILYRSSFVSAFCWHLPPGASGAKPILDPKPWLMLLLDHLPLVQ